MEGDESPDGNGGADGHGDADAWTVLVALSNPWTAHALVSLGAVLARHHGGRVLAAHVVTVPDQTPLDVAAEHRDRIEPGADDLLADARVEAADVGVPVETRTVLSHRGLPKVFDAARTNDADAVVMGYGGARLASGRAEGVLEELAADLPCDVLVLDGETFDPAGVLVPTAGGYSADLSAAVAGALRDVSGADVTLLHVADDGEADDGRAFLAAWADEHGLADAERRVETGDVEAAVARHAAEATLVVVGATGRGLLARIVRGSLTLDVLEDLETPVLMAERPDERSVRERLLGRR